MSEAPSIMFVAMQDIWGTILNATLFFLERLRVDEIRFSVNTLVFQQLHTLLKF
jgi:hypothetical protein